LPTSHNFRDSVLGRVLINRNWRQDLINVRIRPLCGLKSDISRGQRSAMSRQKLAGLARRRRTPLIRGEIRCNGRARRYSWCHIERLDDPRIWEFCFVVRRFTPRYCLLRTGTSVRLHGECRADIAHRRTLPEALKRPVPHRASAWPVLYLHYSAQGFNSPRWFPFEAIERIKDQYTAIKTSMISVSI